MPPPETNPEFEALLAYLKHNRECDLTGYKRSTLMRRFQHRMQQIGIDSHQSYLQYLQAHSQEHLALLHDVLINFTAFFRDPDAWVYLATEIIPKIIENKHSSESFRVWSAGCSTGQEIYSFLIVMSELLGLEFCLQHIQCYATDADEDALQRAQEASYSDFEITGISPELLEKYFQQTEQGYVFHPELRRLIDFKQHDLMQDIPIPEIDLLICRNVLMYFTVEAQASILTCFHSSLKNTGFLFLGKPEMLVCHKRFFTPTSAKQRFYTKELNLGFENSSLADYKGSFWRMIFETSPIAQVILDFNGHLVSANQKAMLLFGLALDDLKRPIQALELGKIINFDALKGNLNHNHHQKILENCEWITPEGRRYFDIEVITILNTQNKQSENIISFFEMTTCEKITEGLEDTNSNLKEIPEKSQELESKPEVTQQETELQSRNIFDEN